MASIKIADLQPAGSDLFDDSESFMNELTKDELDIQGGGFFAAVAIGAAKSSKWCIAGIGAAFGFTIN